MRRGIATLFSALRGCLPFYFPEDWALRVGVFGFGMDGWSKFGKSGNVRSWIARRVMRKFVGGGVDET
jgi:hypothetical protein